MLNLDTKLTLDAAAIKASNLCSRFEDDDLDKIGNYVWDGYISDKHSRAPWERRNAAGMDLALQLQKEKTFPWPNCSNVAFPLVTIAALQFHARAYPSIIQGTDIVKCRVIGDDPDGTKTARAERVSTHMSWQCYEQDSAWEEQHDRELLNLAIVGCNFIKTYYDSREGHNVSELVLAKDLVVNYFAKSVETTPRKTQIIPLYRNDIYEKVKREVFRNVLEEAWFKADATVPTSQQQIEADRRQGITPPMSDQQTPFLGLEQHVLLDLDQDGYAEPYIITIEETTHTVLRIVCGFDREEDIERDEDGELICIHRIQYYTKYSFIPSPDGGLYDIGFGVLLGPLNESVNSAINQLFDAGTWATTAGGFLGRGAKIRGGIYTFAPLEWKRVDSTGDDLRKNIVPHEVREPSAVLFNLLSLLINYTNRISGANDMMVGENPGQNTPAETSRSMIEQGMQIYNAVFKRVWRAMKEEFKKLYVLNAIYLPDRAAVGSAGETALKADYLGDPNAIAPAADPNLASKGERLQQATALVAAAMQVPGYDQDAVQRRYLKAIGVDAIDEVFPGTEGQEPPKDVKLQIQEMKSELEMAKLQVEQARSAAEMTIEQMKLKIMIAELMADIELRKADQQGDVEDRQIGKLNAVLGLLKQQDEGLQRKIDMLMKGLEMKTEERELAQKDRELDIKEKVANKPKAAA